VSGECLLIHKFPSEYVGFMGPVGFDGIEEGHVKDESRGRGRRLHEGMIGAEFLDFWSGIAIHKKGSPSCFFDISQEDRPIGSPMTTVFRGDGGNECRIVGETTGIARAHDGHKTPIEGRKDLIEPFKTWGVL
jgi:hypothetical protein